MLYLASQSPRRRQLLEQVGLDFEQVTVAVVERQATGESAADYVSRVARDKARAGWAALAERAGPDSVVLGADTEVVLEGEVFGKPADAAAAAAMLRRLSGRTHEVVSTLWLVDERRETSATQVSQVRFASLQPGSIDAYLATDEFLGKAGGYAIQGRAAAFVEHLAGSYSGVMGLPLFETVQLLRQSGHLETPTVSIDRRSGS